MADARDIEMVKPYGGDPFVGHLSTPISDSAFTKAFIGNLPAYRKGLSPILRGIEIGMAHGYFLVGPWVKLGPLRDYTEAANLGGLVSTLSLVLIATACMSIYGIASFQVTGDDDYPSQNPQAPTSLKSAEGWSQLTAGFFVGAMGGAFVAYFLLENLGGVDAIFRGLVN
ncbi:photosystem I reaction center protein subunit XI [Laspinema sp. A4]|uniref:photosystem I reaction center protein subunit XI n=1 Tax=Laspinema sp. D2d TaxID=2953686 RepID=UPI0021BAF085|nr:photosystem I reaction center protein subunit XI [Laspinema sp. D2d]MCT7983164.1 photosystem I reaction center protein subunit XI [Laspinema sp. D2d]